MGQKGSSLETFQGFSNFQIPLSMETHHILLCNCSPNKTKKRNKMVNRNLNLKISENEPLLNEKTKVTTFKNSRRKDLQYRIAINECENVLQNYDLMNNMLELFKAVAEKKYFATILKIINKQLSVFHKLWNCLFKQRTNRRQKHKQSHVKEQNDLLKREMNYLKIIQ